MNDTLLSQSRNYFRQSKQPSRRAGSELQGSRRSVGQNLTFEETQGENAITAQHGCHLKLIPTVVN